MFSQNFEKDIELVVAKMGTGFKSLKCENQNEVMWKIQEIGQWSINC